MKIAICDDDPVCRGRVTDIACDYAEERRDKTLIFDTYSDPETLLRAVREGQRYEAFLLDIVMPGMNGIRLGEQLRKEGVDGKILYLTASEEYALESFKIRAFHYLMKPISKEVFYEVMDEVISSVSIKRDRSLTVKTKDGNARIAFDSILWAELAGRAVLYHLAEGKTVAATTLRTTFSEAVKSLLEDRRFSLCRVGMVVNLHHITMVENEAVIFEKGEKVFLGKKACRDLRMIWNEYWIEGET